MCDPVTATSDSHTAAQSLSQMLKSEAGIEAEPKVLRLFIRANWKRAAALAHTIHGKQSDYPTKEGE